jgi:uncharacterized membrane protein YphA (DoxX/SURF4 family)
MNIIIWIIQAILALVFAMAGIMKSTQPVDKLIKSLPWVSDYSITTVRFIGISELLGAIGIVVPLAAGILPVLSPLAATGLAVVMILAVFHHLPKKEYKEVLINTVLFVLSAVVAFYRF